MLLGLGRIETKDPRNKNYTFAKSGAMPQFESARKVRYWNEGRNRGVVNQGSLPACVGAGWFHYLINGPVTAQASQIPDFVTIYREAQRRDEWPGENYAGTSVLGGAKYLQERGLIGNYWWSERTAEVIQYVLEVGPVVFGTPWLSGMSWPDKFGRVTISGEWEGGHCYVINGVNLQTGEFRAEQSWYPTWGDTGNFWLTFAQVDQLISYGSEICMATEIKIK